MDNSGRKHKRSRKDEASPSNNKRQKVTSTPERKPIVGSPKAGCSAQNRLARIRVQQAADESNLSSENPSINHSKAAGNVVKFPLSDCENKSFNWTNDHARMGVQGRLSNNQSFLSSTTVQNNTEPCKNKSGTVLVGEKSGRTNSGVSDRLKVHFSIKGGTTPNRLKLHLFDGGITHSAPSLKVHSSPDGAGNKHKVHSLSESACKTPSASNRLKIHKSPEGESNRHKVHSLSESAFKTPSASNRLKSHPSPDRHKVHSLSESVFKTPSPSNRRKVHTPPEGESNRHKVHSSSVTPSVSNTPKVYSHSSSETPSVSNIVKVHQEDGFKTFLEPNRLEKQVTPSDISSKLKVQSVSSMKSPSPFKSVSARLKVHSASVDTNESSFKFPDRFKPYGRPVASKSTIKPDGSTTPPCKKSEVHSTPGTGFNVKTLSTPSDSFTSFNSPKESAFKTAHTTPKMPSESESEVKTPSPSDRLKIHTTLQPASILFPSFGYVTSKLKTLSSSFFKSASDRFSFRPTESTPGEKEWDPPPVSSFKEITHVSPLKRFTPYTNRPPDRVCPKEAVRLDSFDPFRGNSSLKAAGGSFGNVSENSASSVFSERGGEFPKGNETALASMIVIDDDSDMDWSPETQEEVVADIRTVRDKISAHNQTSFHDCTSRNLLQTSDEASGVDNRSNLYIIVDTNVFINKLHVLPSILKIEYEDGTFPIVYVPWMVIQELDYFKDGYNVTEKHISSSVLKNKSMKAIRFINDNLISKKKNFVCQPALDATENQLKILSPDDSILSCCFQVGKQSRLMLLSGDVNLCNKAMINSFEVLKPDDAVETLSELKKLKHKVDLIEKVSECMSRLCSFIIYSEWKQTGDKTNAAKFKRMPWSFPDCIRYMKENYTRVFKPFLQKQSQKIIDDIFNIVILNQDLADETKFIELALSLLIFMKTGLSKYELNIEATISDIKKLKKLQ